MSEKELNNKELEKTTGGFEQVTYYNFSKGDTFYDGLTNYVVQDNANSITLNTVLNVKCYIGRNGDYQYTIDDRLLAGTLASYKYLGKDIIK